MRSNRGPRHLARCSCLASVLHCSAPQHTRFPVASGDSYGCYTTKHSTRARIYQRRSPWAGCISRIPVFLKEFLHFSQLEALYIKSSGPSGNETPLVSRSSRDPRRQASTIPERTRDPQNLYTETTYVPGKRKALLCSVPTSVQGWTLVGTSAVVPGTLRVRNGQASLLRFNVEALHAASRFGASTAYVSNFWTDALVPDLPSRVIALL